jgi:methionine sulfoxide reductase heme-binding subunit
MSRPKKPILPWFLLLLLIAAIPTVIMLTLRPSPTAYTQAARATALTGYLFVFFAIVSANYMQPLVRRFGRPFVTLHHWVSIAGLVLLTAHGLFIALSAGSLRVFIPDTSSWRNFWLFAGRPSWYLLLIAGGAALLRRQFKDGWLIVHYFTYVAFFMGTVHAAMGGGSFLGLTVTQAVIYVLTALTIGVFISRRIQERQRAQARERRRQERDS